MGRVPETAPGDVKDGSKKFAEAPTLAGMWLPCRFQKTVNPGAENSALESQGCWHRREARVARKVLVSNLYNPGRTLRFLLGDLGCFRSLRVV